MDLLSGTLVLEKVYFGLWVCLNVQQHIQPNDTLWPSVVHHCIILSTCWFWTMAQRNVSMQLLMICSFIWNSAQYTMKSIYQLHQWPFHSQMCGTKQCDANKRSIEFLLRSGITNGNRKLILATSYPSSRIIYEHETALIPPFSLICQMICT